MPVEQASDCDEGVLTGNGTVIVLDVIKQPHDLTAFNFVDRTRAEARKDITMENPPPLPERTQQLAFADEEVLGDGAKCAAIGVARAMELGDRVVAAGDCTLGRLSLAACVRES